MLLLLLLLIQTLAWHSVRCSDPRTERCRRLLRRLRRPIRSVEGLPRLLRLLLLLLRDDLLRLSGIGKE